MSIFAVLPQDDHDPVARKSSLLEYRKKFRFDYSVVKNVPISASIPDEAKPGLYWKMSIASTSYKLRKNWRRILADREYLFERRFPDKLPHEIANLLMEEGLTGILGYSDPDLGVALRDQRPESFSAYYDLFKEIPLPEGTDQLDDDDRFANYFVAGLNPVMLRRLEAIPGKLGLCDQNFTQHPAFAHDTLESALPEGRLFYVDYAALASLKAGKHPQQKKYLYSPIVVLAVPKGQENLVVIGIQYGQDKESYPFVTPKGDYWSWLVAKTMVKTADSNIHEVVSHLGLTHLLIDPVVISTYRQLAQIHPISILLRPHFDGTIPINALAVRKLINRGGKVEQLLPAAMESGYGLIEQVRNGYHFKDGFLKNDLAARGVGEESTLRNYPYRDDALLIWDAIAAWIDDYVDVYYPDDGAVRDDYELQAWAEEIADPEGGRVHGFLHGDKLESTTELKENLTMIIFTASAQHAAVNFPQSESAATPYQPLAGYAPAPTKVGLTEEDALAFLPPLDRAIKQTHILTLLGSTHYTQLGHYQFEFKDVRILPLAYRFRSRLSDIEELINQRNEQRQFSYGYLLPSNIPQSINI